MTMHLPIDATITNDFGCASDDTAAILVPVLVAQVYAESAATGRAHLLEHLLKPLSLLSLAAVANGLFAKLTLANGWSRLRINGDDVGRVNAGDIIALVSHVQEVSVQAIDGLAQVITASPVLAGSAEADMLLTLLSKQACQRHGLTDNDFDPIA